MLPSPPHPARRVFAKAQEYAAKFPGAVDLTDVAAVDELYASLGALEFVRQETDDATGDSVVSRVRFQPYQVRAARPLTGRPRVPLRSH